MAGPHQSTLFSLHPMTPSICTRSLFNEFRRVKVAEVIFVMEVSWFLSAFNCE
jgi:hypothetical protein